MEQTTDKQTMNIVIAGHVDHGKSTVVGRLLFDTGSLPEGKLDQVKANCERNSKPFEFAFLIDALKDEQSQGITIDAARVFFKTALRHYIIIDAPGHIEFLKNMVTGASRAEAALLVIDADEGVRENSRRHGYMLSMLGINQIAVLVNKMDLAGYRQDVFDRITAEYTAFLAEIGVTAACFIPVCAIGGDTIAAPGQNMPWYAGPTVLAALDTFRKEPLPVDKPFRMPVQGVYKFTKYDDNRRIIAGTINTGSIAMGDEIIFYPSGKKSRIKSIEAFNVEPAPQSLAAGQAAGFTLDEQIYVGRGEIMARVAEDGAHPRVTSRMLVSLFWLGKKPLSMERDYVIKIGTARVPVRLEKIIRVIDASNLDAAQKDCIDRHEVAECVLKTGRAIAFDVAEEFSQTGRFVIVDEYEISGGGIIRQALEDQQSWVRDKVIVRDYKWERSIISDEERLEKYHQKAALVLITGRKDTGKKPIAKLLESHLFASGNIVYFLGMGNLLYGVDADIQSERHNREHIRRLAELANIMCDAGVIFIVTAIEITEEEVDIMKTIVRPEAIEVIWVGDTVTTDIEFGLQIATSCSHKQAATDIVAYLHQRSIIQHR